MTLSLKKSIVQDHISSDRHCGGKEARSAHALRQEKVLKSWNLYQKRHADDLSGTGITHAVEFAQSLARVEVVSVFLKAGTPSTKITHLHALLGKESARLTGESHLRTYINFILEIEAAKVKAEVAHHPTVSVICYSSTHPEEALAVLVRLINEEFEIAQRLVRLHVLAKSLSANELARDIITILCTGLQIPASSIICAIRDGASVNGTAVRTTKEVMFPSMMDIICVSHTLEYVGRHMETPLLNNFLQKWIALFAHSPATKLL